VSTRYHDFCFKVRFLEPFYSLLQFRVAALICEISGVDEYVTLRKLRCLVVGVRDADDARLPKLLWMRELVSHDEPYQSDMFRQDEPSRRYRDAREVLAKIGHARLIRVSLCAILLNFQPHCCSFHLEIIHMYLQIHQI
jgi:hypothetical protein